MRFPNIDVNRKNVEEKKLYYWIRKAGVIIIDYGYPYGDIHIYKHLKSTDSSNLKDILEEYLDGDELMAGGYLEVLEINEDFNLKSDIFSSKIQKKDR